MFQATKITAPPAFLYFDLGIVLVDFSVDRMLRQMGEAAGVEPSRVREVVYGGQLQPRAERGEITEREFYEAFCEATGTQPDFIALAEAANAIFELNVSMVPVVARLQQAGYPMGILSNTCRNHWEYCRDRFRIVAEAFDLHTLSYEVGATKPNPKIFEAAAQRAGVQPEAIFFVDDLADNVAGAKAAGWDAVQYTSTPALVSELRRRGLRFNY